MRTNPEDPGQANLHSAAEGRAEAMSDTVQQIDEALRSLAPTWVRTGARAIDAKDLDGMWPNERAAMARAVDHRRAEFATGRALLRQLIGDNVEIEVAPDRRPILPLGVTGTLAHDREVAVAAISTRSSCRALGVDVEPTSVFTSDEALSILRPEERHLDPHHVFVLKEAVYKAWSSLGGGLLEHHEVVVDVDETGRVFTALGPGASSFAGRYSSVARRFIALVVVDAVDGRLASSQNWPPSL